MSALMIGPNRRQASRPDFAVSPLLVFYELTRACDLVCLHCRACAQKAASPDELTTMQSRALLAEIASFPAPPLVVFTGGDPFKRQDLIELVDHAASLDLEVAVTPSATPLVTRERLAALRDAGARRIAVSLDGPDRESHDLFRGVAGSFKRTLEIIQDARSLGFPVQVNTTVTPHNWQRIDEFAALLDDLDIVLWSVFFLVPVGRGETQPRLSAEQVELVFDRLWRESRRGRFPIKTTEAPHYRRFVAQREKALRAEGMAAVAAGDTGKMPVPRTADTGKMLVPRTADTGKMPVPRTADRGKMLVPRTADTGKMPVPPAEDREATGDAGRSGPERPTFDTGKMPVPRTGDAGKMPVPRTAATGKMHVSPYAGMATNDGKGIMFVGHNGVIYPSGFLPITCGVFPRDNVVETYQQSPLFRELRNPDLLQGKCGVCKFRTLCGGSRARSYAVRGNPLAAEPDCAYLPEEWLAAESPNHCVRST